jgi:hypothetical protein
VCFAALVLVVWLAYSALTKQEEAPAVTPGNTAVIELVSFIHEDVGGYHNVGPTGQPAWWISHDPELVQAFGSGNGGVVLVRCNCGLTIRMLGQTIDADGIVTPSIWHDVPECGWHVYGRFQDWDAGRWDTAGKTP